MYVIIRMVTLVHHTMCRVIEVKGSVTSSCKIQRLTSDLAGRQCSSMADQQYSCSTCLKQFSSRWGLLRHQKKEHGVESEGGMRCREENVSFLAAM